MCCIWVLRLFFYLATHSAFDHLLITVMSSICSQILTKNPGYSHTLTNSHTILTSSGATVVINKLEYVNSSLAENEKVF